MAVRDGRLELLTRSGQVIVPRLGTAHNFTTEALPIYQLLGDLQSQSLRPGLSISWGPQNSLPKFTPRLTLQRAVLKAAAWHLVQTDLVELVTAPPGEHAAQLKAFRERWQLPRFFTLTDGDNELLVDAESELLVQGWLDAIRLRSFVHLTEFLFDQEASPVRDGSGQAYVSQGLALLIRQGPSYAAPRPSPAVATAVQRDFSLGSEWLYYKLYCGPLLADRVLLEVIHPLVAALRAQGLADTWFFVRYADPDHHLRVRWHLPHPERVGEVVRLVAAHLDPMSGPNAIWKVQADTYRRELERYGYAGMAAAEELFCYQSEALLGRMAEAARDTPGQLWPWGLVAIDELLTAFDYSLARKGNIIKMLKQSYAQEFKMTRELKKQLDSRYREQRLLLQQAWGPIGTVRSLPTTVARIGHHFLVLDAAGQLEVPLDELLSSLVHMLLNRLLPSEPRQHELVLYDFLFRHYTSCQARLGLLASIHDVLP